MPISRCLAALALAATIVLWGGAVRRHPRRARALRLRGAAVRAAAARRGGRARHRRRHARRRACRRARDLPAIAGGRRSPGMTAYQLLLNAASGPCPAGTASLLVNLSPVFTALAAAPCCTSEMTARAAGTGVAIACAGASLIAVTGARRARAVEPARCWCVGAAVAQAAFFVGQKPLLRRYGSLRADDLGDGARRADGAPVRAGPAARGRRPRPPSHCSRSLFLGLGASGIGFVDVGVRVRAHRRLVRRGRRSTAVVRGGVRDRLAVARRGAASRDAGRRRRSRSAALLRRRTRSASAAQAEPAQHQQRALAEGARPRQHAERDGRAVGVEERADAEQLPLAQLGEEDDVDDDEAVRRREAADRRRGACRAASPARWRACRR